MNLIYFVIGVAILATLTISWFKVVRYGRKNDWDEDQWGVCAFIGAIVTIGSLIVSGTLVNLTWLQIWIAPKVYLIEFAKDLIHK